MQTNTNTFTAHINTFDLHPGERELAEPMLKKLWEANGAAVYIEITEKILEHAALHDSPFTTLVNSIVNICFGGRFNTETKIEPFTLEVQQVGKSTDSMPILSVASNTVRPLENFEVNPAYCEPDPESEGESEPAPREIKKNYPLDQITRAMYLINDVEHHLNRGLNRDVAIHVLEQHIAYLRTLNDRSR